ncbi:MAG: response regulator [Bdellovibrionales bacterium]
MIDSRATLAVSLGALRIKYTKRLRQRVLEIQNLLTEVSGGTPLSRDAHDEYRRIVHNLEGSGQTYGFPAISEVAAEIGKALDAGTEPALWLPLNDKLIDNCMLVISARLPHYLPPSELGQHKNPLVKKSDGRNKILLVIDDDPTVGELLTEILKDIAVVVCAKNGSEGLNAFFNYRPDLVLLNDRMPDMRGMTVLETVQADERLNSTPIVMLTARKDREHIQKVMVAGALGYIVKPFDPKAVTTRIRNFLAFRDTCVLIADDDESVCDVLRETFRRSGVEVKTAFDGKTAIKLVRECKPRLFLLDWMMPGAEGPEVLRFVRNDPLLARTQVIMLTARQREEDVREGIKHGAIEYIVKPFAPDEVLARCLRHV